MQLTCQRKHDFRLMFIADPSHFMVYTCVYMCAHLLSGCHFFVPLSFLSFLLLYLKHFAVLKHNFAIVSLLFSLPYTWFSFTVAYNGVQNRRHAQFSPFSLVCNSFPNQQWISLIFKAQFKWTFNLISALDSKYCKNKRWHVGSHDGNVLTRQD